jgi:hypothetical protein
MSIPIRLFSWICKYVRACILLCYSCERTKASCIIIHHDMIMTRSVPSSRKWLSSQSSDMIIAFEGPDLATKENGIEANRRPESRVATF